MKRQTRARAAALLTTLVFFGSGVFAAQGGEEEPQPTEGYASCLHAYGVKIEASERVERDWLYLSALVYEHMTAHETRYKIRETLKANGFRILLARADQTLDTLPEYEGDEGAREAGGLGGNPGEYRIALRVGHPHVLIHELAHGIYHSAIQFQELDGSTDPEAGDAPPKEGTFSHELYAAYDVAMESELWTGMYFEAHPDEYWAEGVTLWFRSAEQNFVEEFAPQLEEEELALLEEDSRAFLKQRDPVLYALCARIYPAADWWPLKMRIFGELGFEFDGSDGGPMGLVNELEELMEEEPNEAARLLQDIRNDITREEGAEEVMHLFGELLELVEDPRLIEALERHMEELESGADEGSGLDLAPVKVESPVFEVRALPEEGRLSVFRPHLAKYVEVFGVHVIATESSEDAKVIHAATVLAEWLDNDEDGVPDDAAAHRVLVKEGAFLVMPATERDMERLHRSIDFERLERAGFRIGQDLYAEETFPEGPPYVKRRGRFDATLEEVLHLVSNGWVEAHPEDLGYRPGSRLTDAMDKARGGRFRRIPRDYPEEAWYHYDDRSCDYECMAAEYLYWALTSHLGGQDYPGRAEEIAREWECPTPALLLERDPAVVELLTDPKLPLPKVLPDGIYSPKKKG